MRLLFFLFLVLAKVLIGNAQTNWSKGVIVLNDETVVTGELQFQSDVLLLRDNEATTIYTAHQVSSFRYYDSKSNINRHYLSLSNPRFVFPVLHFFEVVAWGDISVVRRDNHPLLNGMKDETEYTYYSMKEKDLIPLKKFKARVYDELLAKHSFILKEFVASEHLSPHRMGDAIRIIKFCNQQVYASMAAL